MASVFRSLDPVGTVLRWRSAIFRRKCNVPTSLRSKRFRGVGEQRNSKEQDFARKRFLRRLTPNALWHIDSNHKLIRWRLITHVCVDEYSRIIIYAHCCNNNKADTVVVVCVRSLLLWSIKVTSSTYQCSVCFNLCDLNLEVIKNYKRWNNCRFSH